MAEVSTRRLQTRERLMASAAELFAERSVQGASVEEICERAGFTRGAFYSNFESKDELVLELVRSRGEELLAVTKKAIALLPEEQLDGDGFTDIMARLMAVLAAGSAMEDHWVMVRSELQLYAHRNPDLRPALVTATEAVADLAVAAMSAALKRQNATLRIPMHQFLIIMDAYFDRARSYEILSGGTLPKTPLQEGLNNLLRALIVFPDTTEATPSG